MNIERTFVMVKPDGIQRGLMGEVISRFEKKGLKFVAVKMRLIDKPLAQKHYAEHKGKGFYDSLIEFITSGPVLTFVIQGPDAISIVRKLVGATSPANAEPGSIRGDYVIYTTFNIIHASDSKESSAREISLFFDPSEIIDYDLKIKDYLF